jgi:hypothetical protein
MRRSAARSVDACRQNSRQPSKQRSMATISSYMTASGKRYRVRYRNRVEQRRSRS